MLFTKANSTRRECTISVARRLVLILACYLFAACTTFAQDSPQENGFGGSGEEPSPPQEKVWLTGATVTNGHIVDTGDDLIPVASLDLIECWLKINSHPMAPSIPWTEVFASPDTTEMEASEPLLNTFMNGLFDGPLPFPLTPPIMSTEGVAVMPIIQDGGHQDGTVLDAFTYKWMRQLYPGGRESLETGPLISADSVSIPYPSEDKVGGAESWWRGPTPDDVRDEVFVRVTYANSRPEDATLKLYLEHPAGIPVEQNIESSIFAAGHHVADGESGGLRTWFLKINRDQFELDGGTYEAVVDMINADGEVVDSIEIEIPIGEEN